MTNSRRYGQARRFRISYSTIPFNHNHILVDGSRTNKYHKDRMKHIKIVRKRQRCGQYKTRSPPIGGVGKTPCHFNSTQSVGGGIFGRFSNFHKCRLEVAGDVISSRLMGPDVYDNRAKFGDPCNNLSQEIAPEAVRGGIFDGFFMITSDRK